jgi:ATP-dependent Clp protease protease subunit
LAIREINKEDEGKSTREPIDLVINSFGGDVYAGFGLVDIIQLSETPIHVTATGRVMSMALPIFSVGHKRIATERTTFMYHELLWDTAAEKLKYHRQEVKEAERMQQMIDDILVEHTSMTQKQLDKVKAENREWYMDAEEAMKSGIVDEII